MALFGVLYGGVVVNKVIENKGYKENWFWWGFFFGIFALIVAITKQNVPSAVEPSPHIHTPHIEKTREVHINEISADKIDVNSAVHIVSWKVCAENAAEPYISVDFFNLSDTTISAVLFTAYGYNSFGDCILVDGKETFDVLGQDIHVSPGKHCNIKVKLPNENIRKVKLAINKICFSNDTIIQVTSSKWVDTKQHPIDPRYSDCVKYINPHGAYHAVIEKDYWQCVCGFVNTGSKCIVCEMSKYSVGKYTADKIESTYQRYLRVLEAEEIIAEERRKAAEKRAEQEKEQANAARKASIKRWMITGVVALVLIIGIVVGSHIKREKDYQAEIVEIATCIDNEEYDDAFSIMISSDSYEKLAEQYGSLLWKKQQQLDNEFAPHSWTYAWENDDLVYYSEISRNGICYYNIEEKSEYCTYDYLYAVTEDGEKHTLFWESCYDDEGYISINGLGYGSWDDGNYAMWSNGWIFISVTTNYYSREKLQFAVKYDENQDKVIKVELPEDVRGLECYAKMKDGNILMATESINDIDDAENIWLFDVVEGTLQEISYSKLLKRYGDIAGSTLYVLAKAY